MSSVSTFNHTNPMTDNIIDRDDLQDAYIRELIDGMDHKDMYAFVYDTINDNLEGYSMTELIEEVEEYDPELLKSQCHKLKRPRQPVGKVAHEIGTGAKTMYCRYMDKTPYTDPCTYAMREDMRQLKEMISSDLSQYMLEMMPDLNDCVDWVCDRFGLDATDELIDFVADCHDEFFGN